jgi:hypothetical protein
MAFEQRREASYLHGVMKYRLRQQERPSLWTRLTNLIRKEKRSVSKGPLQTVAFILLFNQLLVDRENERQEWTMTHSFYVVMGGFAIDWKSWHFIRSKLAHVTLRTRGFAVLAEYSLEKIPDLPKSHIQDKSKANDLAKLLVCGQTIWFCCQSLSRLSQGFTISLLELNTFAHAICALLSYIFWWEKPLDIAEPTLFESKTVAAWYLADSMRSFPYDTENLGVTFKFKSKIRNAASLGIETLPFQVPEPLPDEVVILRNQELHGYVLEPIMKDQNASYLTREVFVSLNEVLEEAQRYGVDLTDSYAYLTYTGRRSREWETSTTDWEDFVVPLVCAGVCYGGLHATAWNAHFSTPAQQLLWRLSSISLLAFAPLALLAPWLMKLYRRYVHSLVEDLEFWIYMGVCFLLFLFYAFCRVYLVVECFLNLAHLPESVYQVPSWSQYFPHIS